MAQATVTTINTSTTAEAPIPCALDIRNNPFYCPAIPAHNFLSSLRRRRESFRSKVFSYRNSRFVLKPFAAALDRCLLKGRGDSSTNGSRSKLDKCQRPSLFQLKFDSDWEGEEGSSDDSDTLPLWGNTAAVTASAASSYSSFCSSNPTDGRDEIARKLKRKSSGENDDTQNTFLLKTTKRAKSSLSVNTSSFYVTLKREKLRFVRTPSSTPSRASSPHKMECPLLGTEEPGALTRAGTHISAPRYIRWRGPLDNFDDLERNELVDLAKALQDELFGPVIGPETLPAMEDLANKLGSMLPGIRIKERLMERLRDGANYQAVVNFLAENGHLTARVLELFRASQVTRMSLSESLKDANGLNLMSDDLFFVFSKPNSFRSLTALSLDGLRLQTSMLTHIQHLPKLAILSLFDSGIGDEAIYLLVPLRYTLEDLNIARNPAVDDDAVSGLLMFTNLTYLSVADTSIGMRGARRLVKDRMVGDGRRSLIDLPHLCHEYVEDMEHKYLVNLAPPLISNPAQCSRLSAAALKRNLSAHAAVNREISTCGTKKEMVQRLEDLLETRLADLEVRRMVRYPQQELSYPGVE